MVNNKDDREEQCRHDEQKQASQRRRWPEVFVGHVVAVLPPILVPGVN